MSSNVISGSATGKKERLEARVSTEQKALIHQAAKLQGCSLTDFMVRTLQDAAQLTIKEHTTLELSTQDREVFINTLLAPPEPNEWLRRAAQEYNRTIGD